VLVLEGLRSLGGRPLAFGPAVCAMLLCCSSPSSGPSLPAGPHFYCLNATAPTGPDVGTECSGIVITGSDSIANETQVCTSGGEQVVTSCPTGGLLGCCQDLLSPSPGETCYYYRTASYWQSVCCAGGQCPQRYEWSSSSF